MFLWFFFSGQVEISQRLMVRLQAFIWKLAYKEKYADAASETQSQPERKRVFGVFYENISARQINNNLKKTNMKINWSTIKKIIQIIITILTSIVGTLCVQSCMNA